MNLVQGRKQARKTAMKRRMVLCVVRLGLFNRKACALTDEVESVWPSLFLCRDPPVKQASRLTGQAAKENFLLGALGALAVHFYENSNHSEGMIGGLQSLREHFFSPQRTPRLNPASQGRLCRHLTGQAEGAEEAQRDIFCFAVRCRKAKGLSPGVKRIRTLAKQSPIILCPASWQRIRLFAPRSPLALLNRDPFGVFN